MSTVMCMVGATCGVSDFDYWPFTVSVGEVKRELWLKIETLPPGETAALLDAALLAIEQLEDKIDDDPYEDTRW